jgi:formylglycine-generating enzyme required for sulfatase activity
MGLILEEAAEVSELPFVELLTETPGEDRILWARQRQALRVLEQLRAEETLADLERRLAGHPAPEIRAWLAERGKGAARAVAQEGRVTTNGGVELLRIPAGTFLMGSPESEAERYEDEGPQHEVSVHSFYLGKHPVTNEEYGRFLEAHPEVREPDYWSDRNLNQARQPVVGVSWEDAQRFAEWAGGRLPTEAEWEYAARAGTRTAYWWGEELGRNRANCAGCGSEWDGKQTAPVGSFPANAFGLHDTAGNVYEWVEDCWHESYPGAPTDGSAWLESGGGDCAQRVLRGGSWSYGPGWLRSADRDWSHRDFRFNIIGFRLAQDR